jgi:cation diffusion facilitator family transporter
VVILTAACMVLEIVAGMITGSMALLADGWHMATHVLALGLSALAYSLSQHWHQHERWRARFTWGTWKLEVLAGFASGLFLCGVAGAMAVESVQAWWQPRTIHFQDALWVAMIGLIVNLLSAWWLHDDPHEGHRQHHGHHHDLNMRAAYLHVVTDAATSVLAIMALLAGWLWGWGWFDPLAGLVGAAVIAVWSVGLVRDAARILLDAEHPSSLIDEVRAAIENDHTHIVDLHVWRIGQHAYSVALALETSHPLSPAHYRKQLAGQEEIQHLMIEVNPL